MPAVSRPGFIVRRPLDDAVVNRRGASVARRFWQDDTKTGGQRCAEYGWTLHRVRRRAAGGRQT